ncbi:hypothetical protein LEP1GSC124_0387 [Leptospira interrogans serovar Pyrogenes str. 200701872]|uniref:Uncharacterized protein n=1 Tax=Leptospira interrogans serovar Pyrogenes str. 200701872 TaxID=1193029 RepID=M6ZR60_LEPIR|nr:hypothetical protein LEP1GSC124_0387 [Leptospira interrogans serovar Pyrogenes str. 200701872]
MKISYRTLAKQHYSFAFFKKKQKINFQKLYYKLPILL